jgi:hypothetical protein
MRTTTDPETKQTDPETKQTDPETKHLYRSPALDGV